MQRDGEEKARPLAVGIHGAAYNSTYFDANASTATEELCRASGIPFVSINRPQVRGSTHYPPETEGEDDIARQGHYLAQTVLPAVWEHFAADARATSAVLYTHSIGSAVAMVAIGVLDKQSFPLTGLIISGMGDASIPMSEAERSLRAPMFEEGKRTGFMHQPVDFKEERMLRLPQGLSDAAANWKYPRDDIHNPSPIGEILAVSTTWKQSWHIYAAQVDVPVLYALGEFDYFYSSQPLEGHPEPIKEFTDAFTRSPHIESKAWKNAPHCIEHSYMGRAWVARCCSFAIECTIMMGHGSAPKVVADE